MPPRAPTNYREEGVGQSRPTADWRKSPPLSVGAITSATRKYFSRYSKHYVENEHVYANARAAAGQSSKPRYIISDIGLVNSNGISKDRFTWVYLPPKAGAYNVWPKGVVRPWTFIFMHSFGYAFDWYHLGYDGRGRVRKGGRGLLNRTYPPGDQWGHHPTRWQSGNNELTLNTRLGGSSRRVSIHFCVSRRGDVVVSTDLNDRAWHGGGRFLDAKKSNNTVSVGIELEPQSFRTAPGRFPITAPFTKPQMIALAVICKKMDTWRPIKRVYITRRSKTNHKDFAQTLKLAIQHGSGFVQHSDVSPVRTLKSGKKTGGKVDAGAQFNILPGETAEVGSPVWRGLGTSGSGGITGLRLGSGWTELWAYMDRVRKFRAADQLFVADIPSVDFKLMTEFAEALQKSNAGQRSVLLGAQDRIAGLKRAANMQSRKRRATFAKAMTHGTALSTTVANTTAAVAKTLATFDVSNLAAPTGDVMSYDYGTGTWLVGGNDTGSA